MQQQRCLDIDFREIFWVVRFSSFATLSGVKRKWLGHRPDHNGHFAVYRARHCYHRLYEFWELAMAADTSFTLLIGNNIETRRVRAGGLIFREGEQADE